MSLSFTSLSFTSLYFFVFLAVAGIIYFAVPKKYRWIVLLTASYIFYYFCIEITTSADHIKRGLNIVFLVVTTFTVWLSAFLMRKWTEGQKALFESKDEEWLSENKKIYQKKLKRKKKAVLIVTLVFNFLMLFVFKYFTTFANLFMDMINGESLGFKLFMPVAISFYMFQSIGYVVDVYYGKVLAEKNIFKVALFTSFFPQLVQGPISRYDQLAPQLIEGKDFDGKRVKSGVLLMLWGYFKKLVIADRADILYAAIMKNFVNYQGPEIFVGMLCYVLKLYCSFSGGIDIARGVAECVGIDMAHNFRRPFFALSVTEYWRRWHITLGAWMKDYVLYPLTLSKGYNKFIRFCKKIFGKSVASKVVPSGIAMFFVFLLVGIWHGPDPAYLVFGVYNGIIILIETIINETRKIKKIKPKERSKNMQRFITFLKFSLTFMLVFFGKYLSAGTEPQMSASLGTIFTWMGHTFKITSFTTLFGNFFERTGFNAVNLIILVVSTAFLIFIEVMQERGVSIREWILKKQVVWQWVVYATAIFMIILLTAYAGTGGGFAYERF